MLADVLTKPLQGELFRAMRKQLLNWEWRDFLIIPLNLI
jgi:hypothetical protein